MIPMHHERIDRVVNHDVAGVHPTSIADDLLRFRKGFRSITGRSSKASATLLKEVARDSTDAEGCGFLMAALARLEEKNGFCMYDY